MRLIDADDFIARLDHVPMVQDAIKKAMDHMPTIEERKTGRWIDMDDHVMCSCCGATHYGADKNYCPNCGARMRGREK